MARKLNHSEVVKVSRIIAQHFKQFGDNWKWDMGWDDERVLQEVKIPGINSKHVTVLRRSAFGRTAVEIHPKKEMEERIKVLEERVLVLEGLIMEK